MEWAWKPGFWLAGMAFVVLGQRAVGWALRRGFSAIQCVGLGALAWLAGFFLAGISGADHGIFPWEAWRQEVERNLTTALELYRRWGWPAEEMQRTADLLRMMLVEAAPGWLATFCLTLSAAGYWLQRTLAFRRGEPVPPVPPFQNWKMPDSLIWLLLASLGFFLLQSHLGKIAFVLGLNGLVVAASIYALSGLSVLTYILKRRGFGKGFVFFAGLIVLAMPTMFFFVILLGVFDTWWDWRKHQAPSKGSV